jgi:hypothetical protein
MKNHVKPPAKSTELADILKNHINDYRKTFKLHPEHYKVVADIMECRTPYLGGHLHRCGTCREEIPLYNSCRNRHCPKCQSMTKAKWLEARNADLLPVTYVHSVFTLPHEINPVALCNKRIIYDMLFRAVSDTLLTFGRNPKNRLEGKIGFISILHTWTQKLEGHIHLHCVIPGCALSFDNQRIAVCKNRFLFPVRALSRVFRGKFMTLFHDAFNSGKLVFPGKTQCLGTRDGIREFEKILRSKPWVVYSKKPFKGPSSVLNYIARYTHRVAISNHRIIRCENGNVVFNYRDRKSNRTSTETLPAVEFIRRFLIHVVPKKFMRIRYFGFLANRNRKENIRLCRQLLGNPVRKPVIREKTIEEMMMVLTGRDITVCPFCRNGSLRKVSILPKRIGKGSFDILNSGFSYNSS